MTELRTNDLDGTAVDDVRRVREAIARQHGGDLRAHIDETNRIAEELFEKLGIRRAPESMPAASAQETR